MPKNRRKKRPTPQLSYQAGIPSGMRTTDQERGIEAHCCLDRHSVCFCVLHSDRMVDSYSVVSRRISLDKLDRVAIVDKWCVLPIEFLSQSACLLLARHERLVVTSVHVETSHSVRHLHESRRWSTEYVDPSASYAPKRWNSMLVVGHLAFAMQFASEPVVAATTIPLTAPACP